MDQIQQWIRSIEWSSLIHPLHLDVTCHLGYVGPYLVDVLDLVVLLKVFNAGIYVEFETLAAIDRSLRNPESDHLIECNIRHLDIIDFRIEQCSIHIKTDGLVFRVQLHWLMVCDNMEL